MIIDYPDFFAAAFPICEAFYDENISDEQIGRLSRLPIWFTHAKNDPVVDPQETVVPTYRRLMDAGAENVHFTFWDGIEDMHGEFTDENGKPVEYLGHFAWIPMLNDDCRTDFDGKAVVLDGKEVTLLQWLSMQHRS
jgi:predicted peptidase